MGNLLKQRLVSGRSKQQSKRVEPRRHAEMEKERIAIEELVRRAAGGERAAFAGIMEAYHKPMFKFVYIRTGSKEDAEDISQEVWLKVFEKLSTLVEPSRFKPWFFRLASNCVKDFMRRKKIRRMVGLGDVTPGDDTSFDERVPGNSPDGLDELMKKDFWEQVQRLLSNLSKREREVFVLRFLDQLTIGEISQMLRSNESSVKTHLYRALKKAKGSPFLLSLKGGTGRI